MPREQTSSLLHIAATVSTLHAPPTVFVDLVGAAGRAGAGKVKADIAVFAQGAKAYSRAGESLLTRSSI